MLKRSLGAIRFNIIFLSLALVVIGWIAFRYERTQTGDTTYTLGFVIVGMVFASLVWFPIRFYARRVYRVMLALAVIAGLGVLIFSGAELTKTATAYAEELALRRNMVADEILENRVPPNAPGHDANGFRNDLVPASAAIVAIGDSQTWGINANRYQTWPAILGQLSDQPVYSMALGGYGPIEYLQLARDALALQPDTVIVGLYFGNDLWDAYQTAYGNDRYAAFRSETMHIQPDTIGTLADERADNIADFRQTYYAARFPWLFANFMKVVDSYYEADRAWVQNNPENGVAYANNAAILVPGYRLLALNADDPRIAEGLRITGDALIQVNEVVTDAGATLLVILIPTKETVYAPSLQQAGVDLTVQHRQLIEMESRLRQQLVELLTVHHIPNLDLSPALSAATANGQQLYPINTNGHPNKHGYGVIASQGHAYLQSS